MSMPVKRIGWVDYSKAIGIYLMILFHTHCTDETSSFLSTFRMPLFFFISGFLFTYKTNQTFQSFLYKRFRQLVVPYIWINILSYFLWFTILRHYGNNPDDDIAWYEPLQGIIMGIPVQLVHNIPLWSLLCFFVVEIIYYVLYKLLPKSLALTGIFWICSMLNCEYNVHHLTTMPLCLSPAMAALGFYSLGHCCRLYRNKLSLIFIPNIFTVLTSFLTLLTVWNINGGIQFFICNYGNFGLFLVQGLAGVILMIQLTSYIDKWYGQNRLVVFVSKGTLLICGFHMLMFAFIKGVMLFGFGIEPDTLMDSLIKGILFSVVVLILCLPIVYIVDKHMKFLVDK